MAKREPFPLQWPDGVKRTAWRGVPKFESGHFAEVRDQIVRWLKHRGSHVVITSNLPTRSDGLPHAAANVDEPGIAVWWVERGVEHVIACDRWRTAPLNLRAIQMTLEAIRGIERWGTSQMVERAFAGFAALPPGSGDEHVATPPPKKRTWRQVFSIAPALEQLSPKELLALIYARHSSMIRTAHPDVGGSHEAAAELNAARAEAEAELGGTQ